MVKKVAVLGGGNGAHAAAADLTLRGYEVHMYEDARFAMNMQKVFETKTIELKGACGSGEAHVAMVTSNLQEAIDDVKVIVVAVPSFAHGDYAKRLAEVVKPGQFILVVPGTFGSLIFWNELKKKHVDGVVVAETHTLPYATRLTGPGQSLVMSKFNPLKVGVMPACKTAETMAELEGLFDGLEAVESVIACGLSSLNPIIHVPGCILNAGRIELAKGEFYFYTEGFTPCVARAAEAIDQERIALLKCFDYQADIAAHGIGGTIQSDNLQEVIASDPNFAKIKGPADFTNRYYSEDIPYGIASWAKLGAALKVDTPVMDSMVNMGTVLLEKDCWKVGHSLEEFGIADMDLDTLKKYLIEG